MSDKHLNRFILLFYILASGYALSTAYLQKVLGVAFESLSYLDLTINYVFNYGTKFLFILFAVWFTRRYLLPKKLSLIISILIHTLITVALTMFSAILLMLFEHIVFGGEQQFTFFNLFSRISYGSSFNFFVYFSLITMVYAFYYLKKQKDQELREVNLRSLLLDSKINALQSQLQPHFLFNALNDISSLVDIYPQKSQDAIADLSDMLRLTLNTQNLKFVPFSKELAILQKYMDIEKIRFDDKLMIHLRVSNELYGIDVPPLILQPIVENSVKHGFSYTNDYLTIVVNLSCNDSQIIYTIENNGSKVAKDVQYGKGISNIISRLETIYGNDFMFELKNSEKGVLTSIKFPRNAL